MKFLEASTWEVKNPNLNEQMRQQIHNLKNEALALISQAKEKKELQELRLAFLGRKGKINQLLSKVAKLEKKEKISFFQTLNEVKKVVQQELDNKLSATSLPAEEAGHAPTPKGRPASRTGRPASRTGRQAPADEWFDPTLPGKKPTCGHLHLVTQAIQEISTILERIGFVRVRYPEVEWDWYAFESLNMPENHPARDDFESFYIDAKPSKKFGKMCLTPHTSSGQVREMQQVGKPPIRMTNIAKCYRPNYDTSHTPMFHQFEGLVIDKNIAITHLKGVLDYFAKEYFGSKRATRLRPFHFQFTEPSFEVDITCGICNAKGCRFCKEGWLELGGAGMVHPQVLKNGGLNPVKYSGFAFGWGVERVLMMKSGLKIPDMRILYHNDLRFLEQF